MSLIVTLLVLFAVYWIVREIVGRISVYYRDGGK